MHITDLANELLLHIFQAAPTISALLSLSRTCKHFQTIFASHRLPTLYLAGEVQYGPLDDAVRVVTHNESQPAHIPRPAPNQSLPLLKQLVGIGRVAEAWAGIYPKLKWRGEASADRKLLDAEECYRLRRACYRIWLYTLAFHTRSNGRYIRQQPQVLRTRALLLRPWPTSQLAEILDLQSIFRHVLHNHICPSNGTVLRRHKQRWPDDPFPLVSAAAVKKHEQQSAALNSVLFHSTPHVSRLSMAKTQSQYAAAVEGWGDEISQYYVIEDMLKINPGQLMQLFVSVTGDLELLRSVGGYEVGGDVVHGTSKGMVERFVTGLGDWFENNGETLCETAAAVIGDRGRDLSELREGIEEGWEGIARKEN